MSMPHLLPKALLEHLACLPAVFSEREREEVGAESQP